MSHSLLMGLNEKSPGHAKDTEKHQNQTCEGKHQLRPIPEKKTIEPITKIQQGLKRMGKTGQSMG